jgi:hypothetical protein
MGPRPCVCALEAGEGKVERSSLDADGQCRGLGQRMLSIRRKAYAPGTLTRPTVLCLSSMPATWALSDAFVGP